MYFYLIVLSPLRVSLCNKFYSLITFNEQINAVLFTIESFCFNTLSLHMYLLRSMRFSQLKLLLHFYITDSVCSENLQIFVLFHLFCIPACLKL